MKIRNAYFLLVLGALALTGCHSSKKASETAEKDVTAPVETVKDDTTATTKTEQTTTTKKTTDTTSKAKTKTNTATTWKYDTNFTSKVKVTVNMDGKDITTTGSLKMRKDDVIQVSLVDPYLGIAEVGRLEISPDSVLVIDKINKRYVSENYKKLSTLAGTKITFAQVQEIFWKEANDKSNDGNVTLTIPTKKPVELKLKVSNIGKDSKWDGHTKVSAKYKKVSIDSIFKQMMGNKKS